MTKDKQPSPSSSSASSGLESLTKALDGTVGSIQTVFGGAMASLSKNVQQNAMMLNQMNSMLENMLVHSVVLTTNIRYSPDKNTPILYVKVKNVSFLPILHAGLSIEFAETTSPMDVISLPYSIDTVDGHDVNDINLYGNSEIVFEIALNMSQVKQLNGKLCLIFPSPGTDQQLSRQSEFGIHYLQQHQFTYVSCSRFDHEYAKYSISSAASIELQPSAVREILQIPALDALHLARDGVYIGSSNENVRLILELQDLPDTPERVKLLCQVTSDGAGIFTAQEIVHEWQRLGKAISSK